MTKKQNPVPTPVKEDHPKVKAIKALFWDSRSELEGSGKMRAARKIERQIAELVAEVAAELPNSEAHGDALAFHEYMLLSLARMSKRPSVGKQLRDAAYAKGAESVTILLQLEKHDDLGAVFSASNLAVDLIHTEKRSQEGLDWMLKSRALLTRLAGKKKLPKNVLYYKLYSQDFGIAQAHYDLGNKKAAKTILLRVLRLAPPLHKANWSDLRGVAKAAELLAQIQLDELDAKRQAEVSKAAEAPTEG